MAALKVFFVYLRRPGPNDPRTDPLYEFGSFGCTKCHCTNLFHPCHAAELEGSRLAFVQGGDDGSRLVFLTPPITVRVWRSNCEARWAPPEMPLKYSKAPILVANNGSGDFPLIERFIGETKCPSRQSGLSSRLRSRSSPLPVDLAAQVVSLYERHRKKMEPSAIASTYTEALPYITKIDGNRHDTCRRLLRKLRAEADRTGGVLHADVAALDPKTPSRCRSSLPRQSECRTRRTRSSRLVER